MLHLKNYITRVPQEGNETHHHGVDAMEKLLLEACQHTPFSLAERLDVVM